MPEKLFAGLPLLPGGYKTPCRRKAGDDEVIPLLLAPEAEGIEMWFKDATEFSDLNFPPETDLQL
jgi:hypothetical protein